MVEEANNWLKQAEADLRKALILKDKNEFDGTTFYCQQTAEKALKAVYIKIKKELLKTHDLSLLGREIKLPEDLLKKAILLNPFYTSSRYPLTTEEQNLPNEKDAQDSIKFAEEILKWCKEKIGI